MKLDSKTSLRKRFFFLAAVGVMLYVLASAAIAWNTVDTCGDESSPKHWAFFPPAWVCERHYIVN